MMCPIKTSDFVTSKHDKDVFQIQAETSHAWKYLVRCSTVWPAGEIDKNVSPAITVRRFPLYTNCTVYHKGGAAHTHKGNEQGKGKKKTFLSLGARLGDPHSQTYTHGVVRK